ncbi:MAG: hypothetical protein FWF30_02220, partial [Coriobacteriia bacterium]|nr:hypothetical protein [Coriobacteriia bacterium]
EALAYIDNRRKAGRNIALGVGLILLGVAGLVLLDGTILQNGSLNTAGLIVFFIALIAAVPIFIVSGLRMNNNADYKANGVRLDASCADQVAQQYARFMQRFTILVALGVVLILVGVALVAILSGLLTQITSSGFALSRLTTLPVALLLVLIACAAFLFVLMGATKSAYNHLLNRDDFRQQANPKSERIVGTIASVYWPLTVVIYLLWSFIFNAWSISWLVWPIAGIAFGAIAGGISTWHNSNQGEK